MSRSFSSAGRKIAPIREGGCLLLHPLIQKEPPENYYLNLSWVYWRVGTDKQSGSETAFGRPCSSQNQASVVHWGFGLGKINVSNRLGTVKRLSILCANSFSALDFCSFLYDLIDNVETLGDDHTSGRHFFGARRKDDFPNSAPESLFSAPNRRSLQRINEQWKQQVG